MGSLTTSLLNAAGALKVYDNVFATIQNNVANANTPGYAEQNPSLVALPFDPGTGLAGGVGAGPLLSTRSEYLEQSVRDQQSQLASAQQKAGDLGQVQPLFNLASGSGVPGALNAFFDSFSQLSVNPNDSTSRQEVIAAAGQVAQAFHQNAIGITQVSNTAQSATSDAVTAINQIAGQLAGFNQQIQQGSQSSQNAGLNAQIHASLENLSQVANFTVLKAADGTYSVYLGGQTALVLGSQQHGVSADFSSPQTVIRDSQGNDITSQIDSGQLGALIEERNTTLPGYLGSLNAQAQNFADAVNNTLAQGVDVNGNPPAANLFTYTPGEAAGTLAVGAIAPDQIAAALPAAPGGNGNAVAVAALATQTANGVTFAQAYGTLGGQVGRDVANAQQETTANQNTLTQAQALRAAQSGVSLDAEAAKLLQFQQAYQAVGRLVTVLADLTGTLLNDLASVTG